MLTKFVFSLLLVLLTFGLTISPAQAQGRTWTAALNCVDPANADVPTIQGLECLFFNVLQVIIAVAGLVFFVMFIKGGFSFMLSQGDPKALAAVQQSLLTTLIGIIGIIGAFIILTTLSKITGLSLLKFVIPK